MTDLFAQFLVKSGRILDLKDAIEYGFLSTTSTYVSFYIKVCLFLLECQKVQYNYDFGPLYQQLYSAFGEKPEHKGFFTKRASLASRILAPFAQFCFCTLSLVFAILHPSVLFFVVLPLLLAGPFTKAKTLRKQAQGFVVFTGIFCLAFIVY